MELRPVHSSNVSAAGYDHSTRTFRVRFKSGSTYDYSNVPESLVRRFWKAQPHPWTAVGKELKEWHHPQPVRERPDRVSLSGLR